MPRRKYGRLQKPVTTIEAHKCRVCKMGKACPAHPRGIPSEYITGKKGKRKLVRKDDAK